MTRIEVKTSGSWDKVIGVLKAIYYINSAPKRRGPPSLIKQCTLAHSTLHNLVTNDKKPPLPKIPFLSDEIDFLAFFFVVYPSVHFVSFYTPCFFFFL